MTNQMKTLYAYQGAVKDSPVIQAWLARVNAALAAMAGVEVEFATTLQERCEDNKVYHDHDNQKVATFLEPILTSLDDECIDEEALPYYRVQFSDGVTVIADDAELFGFDPKFRELLNAVSGAFACARNMGFVGPWHLAAEGSEEDKAKFLEACKAFEVPPEHWATNHNTPPKFREAAISRAAS